MKRKVKNIFTWKIRLHLKNIQSNWKSWRKKIAQNDLQFIASKEILCLQLLQRNLDFVCWRNFFRICLWRLAWWENFRGAFMGWKLLGYLVRERKTCMKGQKGTWIVGRIFKEFKRLSAIGPKHQGNINKKHGKTLRKTLQT